MDLAKKNPADDFYNAGYKYYKAGEFQKALESLLKAAELGMESAQTALDALHKKLREQAAAQAAQQAAEQAAQQKEPQAAPRSAAEPAERAPESVPQPADKAPRPTVEPQAAEPAAPTPKAEAAPVPAPEPACACESEPESESAPTGAEPRRETAMSDEFHRGVTAVEQGDTKTALAVFTHLAEQGDVNAMYNAGLLCEQESNDTGTARYLLEQAAAQGHTGAIAFLRKNFSPEELTREW